MRLGLNSRVGVIRSYYRDIALVSQYRNVTIVARGRMASGDDFWGLTVIVELLILLISRPAIDIGYRP